MSETTPEGKRCGICNGRGVFVPKGTVTENYPGGKVTIIEKYECGNCGHELNWTVRKDV